MEDVVSWMGDVFDSLNDNSGAVQAIATVVLVAVTFVYALFAAKQAKASVKMAEEMREQRMDAARPVVVPNASVLGSPPQYPSVDVEPTNVGLGPALNVQCVFKDPTFAYYEEWWPPIGPGERGTARRLRRCAGEDRKSTGQRGGSRIDVEALISIVYEDIYGRLFETSVRLKQEIIGWTELRTSVQLIGTAENRVRPTEGWQEVVIDRGQLI
jgi:hypothetical protein